MDTKKDIVLMSVPLLQLDSAITGPYALKSVLQSEGFSCKVYDFNTYLWYEIGDRAPELWDPNGTVFGIQEELDTYLHIIHPVIEQYVREIMENDNPDWIGITQFAWTSGNISKLIIAEFKNQGFIGKTVLGGPNCMEYNPDHHMWNVGDHIIYGEAEISLVELLKGNTTYPGIDNKNFLQLQKLDDFPYPDYSDVQWDHYNTTGSNYGEDAWRNPNRLLNNLYVTFSRGCVRQCTFCDIHAMAPKFKFRAGQRVADEIVHHHKTYPHIKKINFTDSLINGSVSQFEKFLDTIIEYKENGSLPNDLIFWGQAIARPANQHPESHFEKMKKAGISSLSVGIESGSEAVRDHMKKKFSNADLDYTIEMFEKYNLSLSALMIVGYPTETEKDFQDTLDLFTRHKDKSCIGNVAIGPTMVILPNAHIAPMVPELGIHGDVNGDWVLDENTLEVRIERWLRLREHLLELNYRVSPDRHSKQIQEYRDKLIEIRQGKRDPNQRSYIEEWGYDNILSKKDEQ